MHFRTLALTIIALTLFSIDALNAQSTPEQTPFDPVASFGTIESMGAAESSTCEGQTGAAFGLCTAYCESMDCAGSEPIASARACSRVSDRFRQITGIAPPCDCPCVGRIDGWLAALNGELGYGSCIDSSAFGDFVVIFTANGLAPAAQSIPEANVGFCGFGFGTGDFIAITPEQGASCNEFIRNIAAENGLECSS